MDPYLDHDTKGEILVELDAFLSVVLLSSPNSEALQRLKTINKSKGFRTRFNDYKAEVNNEKGRYPTFVALANHAIAQMVKKRVTDNKHRLILCVNDPIRVMTGAVELRYQNEKGKGNGKGQGKGGRKELEDEEGDNADDENAEDENAEDSEYSDSKDSQLQDEELQIVI
ncbi:hypothetical protein MPER_10141 [Moniliophthora perniciosa FA553]|nr:hypothetical protein MPER_10141 [Moniliophthora perniciosa FA553]